MSTWLKKWIKSLLKRSRLYVSRKDLIRSLEESQNTVNYYINEIVRLKEDKAKLVDVVKLQNDNIINKDKQANDVIQLTQRVADNFTLQEMDIKNYQEQIGNLYAFMDELTEFFPDDMTVNRLIQKYDLEDRQINQIH